MPSARRLYLLASCLHCVHTAPTVMEFVVAALKEKLARKWLEGV